MYRIEVAPGEETVFRTIEELAVGIRNGVVTPRSRIYHNASQKWLPIGLHPHYKKAMELPAASAAHPSPPTPVPGVPRIKRRQEAHASTPAPEPRPAPPKVPAPVVSPVITMQQEVLRDLPVVAMPEPLPWTPPRPASPPPAAHQPAPAPTPAPAVAPIAPIAQAVQAQPAARVTFAPAVYAEPETERAPAPAPVPRPAHAPEWHAPESHAHERPTARRSRRANGRPLLLLGVAAAIAVGGHFALTARSSATASATEDAAPAEEVDDPAVSDPMEEPAPDIAPPPVNPAARVTSAPGRVPMTPGPAFAGSVPARHGADSAPRRAAAAAPAPAATDPAAPAIAPAPVELELALPLPSDSLVPVARTGDTMAMKKILRALNGSRPPEAPAAP